MAKRGKSGVLRFVAVALLLLLIAGGLVLHGWYGAGPAAKPLTVQVAEGSSLAGAARALERAGAIRSARAFLRDAKLFGSKEPIHAGEYEIAPGTSAADVLLLLQSGKTLQRLVTIPEGMPSILVHEKLLATPLLTGGVQTPAEGTVLPDSYAYVRGESRAAVLARMQAAMAKELARLWAGRKPTTVVTSPQQAVILASVVEKETGVPGERPMVAAVFSNRLRQHMPLQADPTVIYPVTKGKPLGRRILKSELEADNGYNTYVRAGLPIGPIANPGRASIAAVLNPANSRALYFVADGKGGHVFADTLAQHDANVKRWYAIRHARGEM
ncbi:endolytic transglycosylase MltG [Flavisphingomonas formosensis]|uniref:endolytic transglycosylase MltG n=1 Tax=Flavisphingomonas formosensis TaxID=861534 RepID=UPI0012F7CF07|nr:endolytic transglycosylase MltG [Sphingomonas formosensis]